MKNAWLPVVLCGLLGSDGAVQLIVGSKMITVPASTLSSVDGRLVTSLSKNQVLAL